MATNNNQQQAVLDKALGTLRAGGTVPINKTTAARQVDGVIYIYNPQVVQAFEFVGNKQKTAAAVKAGKISPIDKAQLAAALIRKTNQIRWVQFRPWRAAWWSGADRAHPLGVPWCRWCSRACTDRAHRPSPNQIGRPSQPLTRHSYRHCRTRYNAQRF